MNTTPPLPLPIAYALDTLERLGSASLLPASDPLDTFARLATWFTAWTDDYLDDLDDGIVDIPIVDDDETVDIDDAYVDADESNVDAAAIAARNLEDMAAALDRLDDGRTSARIKARAAEIRTLAAEIRPDLDDSPFTAAYVTEKAARAYRSAALLDAAKWLETLSGVPAGLPDLMRTRADGEADGTLDR